METVKISINNWFAEEHYPNTDFFRSMMDNHFGFWSGFTNEYCQKNKICAFEGCIDMSHNVTMIAPKKWVEDNCPELFTEEKYKKFVYDDDESEDGFGFPFPDSYPFGEEFPSPYGIYYYDEENGVDYDDDEEDDEED